MNRPDPGATRVEEVTAALLDVVLAVMPDAAVVVDRDGRMVAVSAQAEELFGYPAEELAGQPVEVLVPERLRHVHRQHRGAYATSHRSRAMGAGLELFGRRRGGTEFAVDISLAPLSGPEGPLVLAAIRDASERKAATSAQAQLAAIVQSSLDAIIAISVQGMVTSWNPGAMRLLGYDPGDILGQHISLLVPVESSAALEELLAAVMADESASPIDTAWLTKGGDRLDVAISASPMRDPGSQLLGFSIMLRDITERRRAEALMKRQERTQAAMAEIRLALLSNTAIDASLDLICRRTCELLVAEATVIFMEDDVVRIAARAGSATSLVGATLSSPPLVVAEALASGQTQAEPTPAADVANDAHGPFGRGPHLAAPIGSVGAGRGALLVVRSDRASEFVGEEVAMVEALADQAALALELAGAREQREHLLIAGDRERIARDLHDLVIQRLFGTGMGLQGALRLIDNDRAAERVSTAIEDLDATIREIRTAIFALETPIAAASGVRAEILRLLGATRDGLGFEPTVHFDGPVDSGVSDEIRVHLLAVLREALSNVARHAQATRTELELSVGDEAILVVTDNGVGLGDTRRESGLANLRSRAENLGGTLTVSPASGGGTRLEWRVPVR